MGVDIQKPCVILVRKRSALMRFRNVRGGKFKFEETFHDEGQIDMYKAMEAYYSIGFRGPLRPDHVPKQWRATVIKTQVIARWVFYTPMVISVD